MYTFIEELRQATWFYAGLIPILMLILLGYFVWSAIRWVRDLVRERARIYGQDPVYTPHLGLLFPAPKSDQSEEAKRYRSFYYKTYLRLLRTSALLWIGIYGLSLI